MITRYGRHNIGVLWVFAEPLLFTGGVTLLWNLFHGAGNHPGLNVSAFAITGYSTVVLWRNTTNRTSKAIEPNLSLMYHRNVRVIDIFASRIILELSGATISVITILLVYVLGGLIPPPDDILRMMLGWSMIAWFAASLALVIGALCERSDLIERLWHPAAYFLLPVSGFPTMVEWLPRQFQEAILLLPMANGVELIREGYFGSAVHARYDIAYVSVFNLCLTFLGLALARETGRRVEPQ
jgi:capsular polysaccharide transport system permease protein